MLPMPAVEEGRQTRPLKYNRIHRARSRQLAQANMISTSLAAGVTVKVCRLVPGKRLQVLLDRLGIRRNRNHKKKEIPQ